MECINKCFISNENITGQKNINEFYSIEEKAIGSGSFGEIKLGTHKITNEKRAIKILLKKQIENNLKFNEEIQMMKILDHPGIIKFFECFEDKIRVYIVMEYCSGGDLLQRIESQAVFSEKEAKGLFRQMISAINYCHKMNIMHRDLKPENFMFKSMEEDSCIKLIDFGLAKWKINNENDKLVRLNTLVGTAYYIAPEVLESNYNYLCDV